MYSDLKVIIDHWKKGIKLNPGVLMYWMERIKDLMRSFKTINLSHVYREKNMEADRLSKRGLIESFGDMFYELHNVLGIRVKGKVTLN